MNRFKDFVNRFEQGTLPLAEFRHDGHLAMALWYFSHIPKSEALHKVRTGVRRYNVSQGKENTEDSGYHESITVLWAVLILRFLADNHGDLPDLRERIVQEFGSRAGIISEFYSSDILKDRKARRLWIPPDRQAVDASGMILPYLQNEPICLAWNPQSLAVADGLRALLTEGSGAGLRVEHVGSTSVPECAGKGVIDLAVLYKDKNLPQAKQRLDEIGFEHQAGRDPFPEDRPMRTGSIEFEGTLFPIHAHVLREDSAEFAGMEHFRRRLRNEPKLRAAYIERKLQILREVIPDSYQYCMAKGSFVTDSLGTFAPKAAPG